MNIHEVFRRAHAVLGKYLVLSTWMLLVVQVLAVVVFPLIEVTLRQWPGVPDYVLYSVYGFHLAFAAYATFGLYKLKEFVQLANLDELEQAHTSCQKDLGIARTENKVRIDEYTAEVIRSAAVQGALSVLQGLLQKVRCVAPTVKDVETLLAPLVKDRARSLGFCSEDMHNFAVYIFCKDGQRLNVFYRICDDRIQRHDRSWGKGQGHVGIAFAQNRTIISGDIADAVDFVGIGSSEFDTDKEYYASFISTPIPNAKEHAEEPVGVLAITSSRAGQFSGQHKILAESFALILSVCLCAHDFPTKGDSHDRLE